MTVKQFLLKKFPPSKYPWCPIDKEYWELMEEYANLCLYKEKARELRLKYDNLLYDVVLDPIVRYRKAKQCALICVEEMIEELDHNAPYSVFEFYLSVKTELEKL